MSVPNLSPAVLQARLKIEAPSPVERFQPFWAGAEKVEICIKRDDLLHPIISGNKWRKLKYALLSLPPGTRQIISFGGGFSNHLHALAYACFKLDIAFTAIVRGDYSKKLTQTLEDIKKWGARLRFVTRIEYQKKEDNTYLAALLKEFSDAVIIPEGGSQLAAIQGVSEIVEEQQHQSDIIMAPVGSGATLAGLINSASSSQQVIGVATLKGENYLESLVERLLPDSTHADWKILHNYHHGGYAKSSAELRRFCADTTSTYKIPLEPVYSGKLFFAAQQLISSGYFAPGTRIMLLHTGGLQGARTK
ncbi:pyridoxal-phosphate dependent enzyme [Alteromonas pelagimontana]|uniref:Pyridoxal-phosphate dependent enzyme n=1 Tax=Alteromonas pelagimontana TaxID=1858656 RepID=A0A6M4MBT9_9ALTE|nr:pyridoxal-phosphate dependent enzyme [Alteromonas pelagimontana]QJR80080.1 pyridoxal-phosphate dependent enzyme [Alteromonas pelagimontana]